MEDDRLARLLRELPRERAQDGFTTRVLGRLESLESGNRESRRHLPGLVGRAALRASGGPRLMVAAAVLATLVIVAALPRREELAPAPSTPTLTASAAPRLAPPSPGPQTSQVATAAAAADTADTARAAIPPRRDGPEENLDRSQARRLLRELRGEEVQLARELVRLRTARPKVIYIGGDEDVDMVIDLNRVPEARRSNAGGSPNLR